MKKFEEAVYEWMVGYKKNSIKASSYDRLESEYGLMHRYRISCTTIDTVDTDCIQEYLNELVRDGYSLSTIKKQYHLVTAFMDYALIKGIVNRPYHKGVILPTRSSVKKPSREVEAYDQEEQRKLEPVLMKFSRPTCLASLIMIESGMRIGEVLALGWDDIDWKRKAIRIHKTFVRLGNARRSYIQKETKSFSSNRTIPMSKKLYEILLERFKLDTFGVFVIHDDQGNPLGYEAVRWQTMKICEEAGVDYKGQHVFRHTFATNCYNRGCDVKILSKLLGHSDVTVTYNTYIHLFGDALEEMRSVLG